MPNFQIPAKQQPKVVEEPRYNFSAEPEQTKIIAFSGKLGSGKSSCAHYIHSLAFMYALGITPEAYVGENGKLFIRVSDDECREVNLDEKDPEVTAFLAERVWPFIKKYSFADPLKMMVHQLFDIPLKLLYGTQQDKSTPTKLKWDDMPTRIEVEKTKKKKSQLAEQIDGTEYKTGYMTVRDVLEYFGSEICRKMYGDCWANALIKTIQQERPRYAVIDDLRFLNELQFTQAADGKVVRLTLTTPESEANNHISNIAMDKHVDKCDAIINNASMSMEDSFRELIILMMEWGFFTQVNQ